MANKIERVKTSLEIDEDIDLHTAGWIFQRVGWFLMLAFLVCAALGLFGSGVLSEASYTREGNTIKYERFTRNESDTEVEIKAQSKAGRIEIELPDRFTRSFKVEKVMPEPAEEEIKGGSTIYTFSANGEGEVTLFVTSRQRGDVKTTVRINGTDHPFQTYIYP